MIEGWDEVSIVEIDGGDAKGSVWEENDFKEAYKKRQERELDIDMLLAV